MQPGYNRKLNFPVTMLYTCRNQFHYKVYPEHYELQPMKKNLILVCLLISLAAQAQLKIGTNPETIGASSVLELESASKALVVTRVASTAAIASPVDGMIIYDMSLNCFRGYSNGAWSGCFRYLGTITDLNCESVTVAGTLQSGVPVSGVSATVPYTGGNGGTYNAQAIASTGVTGLTATLAKGKFAAGAGSLQLSITGTPTANGIAVFAFEIGCASCNIEICIYPAADAGPDQTGATTCGLSSVALAAEPPLAGTGEWSILSGAGGSVTNPSSPTSTFSGTAGTAYTLRWTITNPPCTESSDDVNITFNLFPPIPTGSATQTLCPGATVADLEATGTAIQWYDVPSGGTALLPSTPLADNTHYYATQTVNGCESTARLDVTVVFALIGSGFITEWRTTDPDETITLPLPEVDGCTFSCTVNWGDGTSSVITTFNDDDITHSYATAGDYQVEIVGTCEGWSFSNDGDKLKIVNIINWGEPCGFSGFNFLGQGFDGCENLLSLGTGSIMASGAGCTSQGFSRTFQGCTAITSIPPELFKNHIAASDGGFFGTFSGCTSLIAIPAHLFDYNTAVSEWGFAQTFFGCTSITSIPSDLFRYNTAVSESGFSETFANCTSLTTIPAHLFDYNTAVSSFGFHKTFSDCNSLTAIPANLFDKNTAVSASGFYETFNDCWALTSIPEHLFDYNTAVSEYGFLGTFSVCKNLISIPTDLFRYNTLVSTAGFYETFSDCEALTSIPAHLFDYNTLVSTEGFRLTFYDCHSLTSIPADLFRYNTEVSEYGFRETFSYCYSLTAIPADLFRYNTLVSTSGFYETFNFCQALTSIPEHLFDYNTAVSTRGFYYTFHFCRDITSIPTDLFKYNTAVSDDGFYGTFADCSITSIPAHLFDHNTLVSGAGFSWTFAGCNMDSIPADLFRYNTAVSASGFRFTFSGCNDLDSIPTDLFRYNTAVSDFGFWGTFSGCTFLLSIPADLFRYNTAVSEGGFYQTFYQCSNLTSIPIDLFRYNTAVSGSGFRETFYYCDRLTSVPTDLFRYNLAVTTNGFYRTFYGCTKLQLNRNIFFADGEEGTRFLNKSVGFTDCFNRTAYTGAQGEAPPLWLCNFGTGTPTRTRCYAGAGNNTTSLSNYPGEVITIDVTPATDWAKGDVITGQTSGRTCIVVDKLTNTTYLVNTRSGAYTLGEIIGVTGNPAKLADQGGTRPTFGNSPWR